MDFMKYRSSSGVEKSNKIERDICENLCNIQNTFHSAVSAFIALERMHNKIVGKIKPGRDKTKLYDHNVKIIVLLKLWLV